MMTTNTQTRLSKSCSDAAVGYATAATAAYAAMTTQTLEFWAEQIRSLAPEKEEEPRSWYRHPDVPQRKPRKTPPQAAMPLMPNPWSPASNLASMMTTSPPAALFSSWLSLVTTPRAPVTWPMAMMFMSAGVPHSVAVPAAEANAAALDAANITAEAFKSAFSNYRTNGGHASTHIVANKRLSPPASLASLSAAPISSPAAIALWPWLPASFNA